MTARHGFKDTVTERRPDPWVAKECINNIHVTDINDEIYCLQLKYGIFCKLEFLNM